MHIINFARFAAFIFHNNVLNKYYFLKLKLMYCDFCVEPFWRALL